MYRVLVGKPEGKKPLGGPRHRWMLKWILKKQNGRACTGLIWLRILAWILVHKIDAFQTISRSTCKQCYLQGVHKRMVRYQK